MWSSCFQYDGTPRNASLKSLSEEDGSAGPPADSGHGVEEESVTGVDEESEEVNTICECGEEGTFSTPCGSMCRECYETHREECGCCDREDL